MNDVRCDRSYWPEGGTIVPAVPADLNTLWDTCADQASIFVAEALISEAESINASVGLNTTPPAIDIYLWTVGGDTLTVSFDLSQEIADAASEYGVRSEAQAEEASQVLHGLQVLEDAVRQAKSKLENKLEDFRKDQAPCPK